MDFQVHSPHLPFFTHLTHLPPQKSSVPAEKNGEKQKNNASRKQRLLWSGQEKIPKPAFWSRSYLSRARAASACGTPRRDGLVRGTGVLSAVGTEETTEISKRTLFASQFRRLKAKRQIPDI